MTGFHMKYNIGLKSTSDPYHRSSSGVFIGSVGNRITLYKINLTYG